MGTFLLARAFAMEKIVVPTKLLSEAVTRVAASCGCLMLFCTTSQGVDVVVEYEWEEVTSTAAFAGRDGAGALTYNGEMFLLGGWGPAADYPRRTTNEVWKSTDGATWTEIKPNTFLDGTFDPNADWEGRHTGGYVVYDNKMWLVGGDANQGHYQNDVWNSTDGVNWTYVNQGNPVPWLDRVLHYTTVFDNKIWVMGGQKMTLAEFVPGPDEFYNDVWNTTDGVNWTQVTPQAPWVERGIIGGSVVFNNKMWVIGGGTYDTPSAPDREYYNDVWSSVDGLNWVQEATSSPWDPRQYHSVTVFDGRMWVVGGYNDSDLNDVWNSVDGVNWKKVYASPFPARHATSVFVHDDGTGEALWMAAGSHLSPDVWKLSPVDGSGPTPLGIIDVDVQGVPGTTGFVWDSNHPYGGNPSFYQHAWYDEGDPRNGEAIIFSNTFGLNWVTPLNQNTYAVFDVDPNGDIAFDHWLDGGDGLVITVTNGPTHTSLLISATPDGDFNSDGTVDGADFLLWQRDPSVGSLADWKANYGVGALTASAATIPEPASGVLLLVAAIGILTRRSQRR
jgi:hypothetical protein